MCRDCWNELGRPANWNPSVQRALELIRTIYETEPTGCPLHVVLDDWNVEDGCILIDRDAPVEPEAAVAAEELVPLLLGMSFDERLSALAYHGRFVEVPL